jgi:hypothetical protein
MLVPEIKKNQCGYVRLTDWQHYTPMLLFLAMVAFCDGLTTPARKIPNLFHPDNFIECLIFWQANS